MLVGFIRLLVYIVIIISCNISHSQARFKPSHYKTHCAIPKYNFIHIVFFFNYKSHSLAKGDLSA